MLFWSLIDMSLLQIMQIRALRRAVHTFIVDLVCMYSERTTVACGFSPVIWTTRLRANLVSPTQPKAMYTADVA